MRVAGTLRPRYENTRRCHSGLVGEFNSVGVLPAHAGARFIVWMTGQKSSNTKMSAGVPSVLIPVFQPPIRLGDLNNGHLSPIFKRNFAAQKILGPDFQ